MSHTKNKSDSPRFQVGDKVRVKHGVIDPEFPDIPLGGWSGTSRRSSKLKTRSTYVIEWDERTLDEHAPGLPQAL